MRITQAHCRAACFVAEVRSSREPWRPRFACVYTRASVRQFDASRLIAHASGLNLILGA